MTTARQWWPDAVAAAVVFAVFAFIVWHARGHSFDPIIDAGRDLYISQQIRSGAALYRDIVYVFPPLAPYALALITGICPRPPDAVAGRDHGRPRRGSPGQGDYDALFPRRPDSPSSQAPAPTKK